MLLMAFIVTASACQAQFDQFAGIFGNATSPTETTLIRQFAKDKPFTFVICSGKTAKDLGQILVRAVSSHPDAKNLQPGKVKAIEIDEAVQKVKNDPNWPTANHVFLLNGVEMEKDLPAELRPYLPDAAEISPVVAWAGAQRRHDPAGPGLQHDVLIWAPDEKSLQQLLLSFMRRRATNNGSTRELWKFLSYADPHPVNHVVVYSPNELRKDLQTWGSGSLANVDNADQVHSLQMKQLLEALAKPGSEEASHESWDFTEWKPFDKIGKEEAARFKDCTRVYFVDRSNANPKDKLPEDVGKATYDESLDILDSYAEKRLTGTKIAWVAFSAPNARMLAGLAGQFPNVESVPTEAYKHTNLDLRYIARIGLAIQGNDITEKQREQLHDITAHSLSQDLNLPVDLRTEYYRDVPADASVESIVRYHGQTYGLDYVCIFKIVERDCKAVYETSETRLSPEVPKWTDDPPVRGSYRGKNAEQDFQDALVTYNAKFQRWKLDYYANCTWKRTLVLKTTAHVRGEMTLLRVSDGDFKPIWTKDVDFPYVAPVEPLNNDTTVVRGQEGRPGSLPIPQTTPAAQPKAEFDAVKLAAHQACLALQGEARLLNKGETRTVDKLVEDYRRIHPYPDPVAGGGSTPHKKDPQLFAVRGDASYLASVREDTQQIIVELDPASASTLKAGRTGKLHSGEKVEDPIYMAIKIEKVIPASGTNKARAVCTALKDADLPLIKSSIEAAHGLVVWDKPVPRTPNKPK